VKGIVHDGFDAIISLRVLAQSGGSEEVLSTIDTGSTAEMTLPVAAIRDLGLTWNRTDQIMLADGSISSVEVYEVGMVRRRAADRGL
jgi:predicted aspartyl protease